MQRSGEISWSKVTEGIPADANKVTRKRRVKSRNKFIRVDSVHTCKSLTMMQKVILKSRHSLETGVADYCFGRNSLRPAPALAVDFVTLAVLGLFELLHLLTGPYGPLARKRCASGLHLSHGLPMTAFEAADEFVPFTTILHKVNRHLYSWAKWVS